MNIDLPAIVLGTMRLEQSSLTRKEMRDLIVESISCGLSGFHLSSEYSSFGLVSSCFAGFDSSLSEKLKLVVKLPAPHFGESDFCPRRLEERLEYVLRATNVEQISVAQWMWRQSPLVDEERLSRLTDQLQEVEASFNRLKTQGKVENFGCFPYSAKFMEHCKELSLTNLQINYLNFWERNTIDGGVSPRSIVLRPLGAGKITEISRFQKEALDKLGSRSSLAHSLRYVLSHPDVVAAVVSLKSKNRLAELLEAAQGVERDISLFQAYDKIAEDLFR